MALCGVSKFYFATAAATAFTISKMMRLGPVWEEHYIILKSQGHCTFSSPLLAVHLNDAFNVVHVLLSQAQLHVK